MQYRKPRKSTKTITDKSTRDQENGHPETKGPSQSFFYTFCGFRGKNSPHISFGVVTTPSEKIKRNHRLPTESWYDHSNDCVRLVSASSFFGHMVPFFHVPAVAKPCFPSLPPHLLTITGTHVPVSFVPEQLCPDIPGHFFCFFFGGRAQQSWKGNLNIVWSHLAIRRRAWAGIESECL